MSIDVVTLPLARYLAGAYIPSSFRRAWDEGDVAEVHHIDGSVTRFPRGLQVGGIEADEAFLKWCEKMPAYMASLPYDIASYDWQEDVAKDTPSWAIEHVCFGALVDEARRVLERPPSLFRRMIGDFTTASHLVNARVFVDVEFDKPFQKGEVVFGSLPTLRRELTQLSVSSDAEEAVSVLKAGMAQARRLRVPLMIDA